MNGVSWLLEKLDLIPDGIDRARQQADKAQRELEALRQRWPGINSPWVRRRYPNQRGGKPPVITGVQGHLKNIDTNTKATANNTKKIGPGDIVFKNLPRALALRGAYQEARVIPQPVPRVSAAAAGGVLSVPTATQGATSAPVAARRVLRRSSSWSLTTSVNARIRSLKKWCNAVRDAMASTRKTNRGSFRDRE
jgi:hypothetical protein